MIRRVCFKAILSSFVLGVLAASGFAQLPDQTLKIQNNGNVWQISYQKSPVTVRIPRASDFRMVESMVRSRPRYLYFVGVNNGVTISGWYEPSSRYKGLEDFWKCESASLSSKIATPFNVEFGKPGDWEAVFYDLPQPLNGVSVNLRAEYCQGGTWVDLHMSKGTVAARAAETRRLLTALVEQIKPTTTDRTKVSKKEIEDATTKLTDGIEALDDDGFEKAAAILDKYLTVNSPLTTSLLAPKTHPWTSDRRASPRALEMLNIAFMASIVKDDLHGIKDGQLYSAWLQVIKYYQHYTDPAQTGGPVWAKIPAIEKLIARQKKGTLRQYAGDVPLLPKF